VTGTALISGTVNTVAIVHTATVTVTPLVCSAGQWLAQYFNGTTLAGPVVGTDCEPSINNNWGAGGPTNLGVGTDNFSVRWTQTLNVPSEALYTFTTLSDDGIRSASTAPG